ncbi:antitoxin of toxin-antitoxin stability system [Agrobacterium tumefaciens]|uniref:antitoxin of toxin-antitoxin stability system n=1 Tax=Agrobacterium tumefaciens TaxID=358 RepID=UPI0015737716|nr:antitoxin of toxin-antitoxin stability system [Agrobacterium tumefaciens]UXT20410.1 antitoxin of toxin-antitoxin stability system [Agrobacterium tumefaciens]WHO20801.1 antitoxin of toxin-antitoxin stability system [Agrobacterium tumefaciens]WHO23586.1 antitoxin of toxin-antitoxin stability system [Agrobacterium tumefaciens]
MSDIVETIVYRLDELSDVAKEKARAWYREGSFDHDWHDAVYEDFQRIAEILGILFKTRTVRLTGGGSRQQPRIWFRGFCSQGDGACWEGYYAYRKSASAEIRAYAPQDEKLHRVADVLQAIQCRNFYQLRAEVSHRGHYYHEYCMAISVERASPTWQDMTADAEETVIEALRDLARWLYRQLECEYDYLTSDEAVDETITANEYTFTEAGRRFG